MFSRFFGFYQVVKLITPIGIGNEIVFGIVEINPAPVKQAKNNVSLNKAKNVKVLKGDFSKSVLIIDPPRDGIGIETMKFINSLGFKKVVYPSPLCQCK